MLRPVFPIAWARAVSLLALPGCLVSFNDYPLREAAGGATSVLGGASNGLGGASAGTGGTVTVSGSDAGNKAMGGRIETGGADQGGSIAILAVGDSMIDDFEDGDINILPHQGRSGSWWIGNDGRGTQTPRAGEPPLPLALVPSRTGSAHGVHTSGGPFLTWGALLGTSLASNGATGLPYDLSRFRGIRFWVRSGSTAPSVTKQLRFNLPTPATNPGGGCTLCTDHFGADVTLTAQWAQVDVPFSSLKQGGWGRPQLASCDLQHVMALHFLFPANVTFDLWLDDVELY